MVIILACEQGGVALLSSYPAGVFAKARGWYSTEYRVPSSGSARTSLDDLPSSRRVAVPYVCYERSGLVL